MRSLTWSIGRTEPQKPAFSKRLWPRQVCAFLRVALDQVGLDLGWMRRELCPSPLAMRTDLTEFSTPL